jgi:hypothetical protein
VRQSLASRPDVSGDRRALSGDPVDCSQFRPGDGEAVYSTEANAANNAARIVVRAG